MNKKVQKHILPLRCTASKGPQTLVYVVCWVSVLSWQSVDHTSTDCRPYHTGKDWWHFLDIKIFIHVQKYIIVTIQELLCTPFEARRAEALQRGGCISISAPVMVTLCNGSVYLQEIHVSKIGSSQWLCCMYVVK